MKQWIAIVCALEIGAVSAPATAAQDDFLDYDKAFEFSARVVDAHTIEARWTIADGYYMYRDKVSFAARSEAPDRAADAVELGVATLPRGHIKFDEAFGKEVETHRRELVARVPVTTGGGAFALTAMSQGCADKGLCYPPTEQKVSLTLAAAAAPGATQSSGTPAQSAAVSDESRSAAASGESRIAAARDDGRIAAASDDGRIAEALGSGSLMTVLPLFFLLGLLLSFTPCVLPMIPILSSIIVGGIGSEASGKDVPLSKTRGLALAAAYSFGMALIYTAMGVAAGLAGEGLAAALQTPAVLATFAGLLALLSLSMFGFYELQLPAALQARLAGVSNNQKGGSFAGVFVMGALSALIVGPCVAAPLAGALLYISQTSDVVMGGGALFAMAAGMSVPLLLVGVSAGTLLPRAGGWMIGVKKFFGALLLGVAIWMVAPAIPTWAQMLAWAALFIVSAMYLRVFDSLPEGASGWWRLWKGVGVLLVLAGTVQILGVATGGRDVLQPLQQLAQRGERSTALATQATNPWIKVKNIAELGAAIAGAGGRVAMLDFYADWCVSCIEMERFTFSERRVAGRMQQLLLVKVDVTKNTDEDKALLKRFNLFGPPGIVFFDAQGREVRGARVIGFQNADTFLASIERATGAAATALPGAVAVR